MPSNRQKKTENSNSDIASVNEDYAPIVYSKAKQKLFGQKPNNQKNQNTPTKRKITIYNDNAAMKSHDQSMSSSLTT